MKVFVVALLAVLLVVPALAKPHKPHHGHSSESSESRESHEGCAPPKPPKPTKPPVRPELQEYINDLRDFVALYPIEEIKEIIGAHLQDEELQATIAWLQGEEFDDISDQIKDSPEVQAVGAYLKNADWPWARKMLKAALAQRRALRSDGKL